MREVAEEVEALGDDRVARYLGRRRGWGSSSEVWVSGEGVRVRGSGVRISGFSVGSRVLHRV